MSFLAIFARALPCSASSTICVERTLTIANSAATKKPFARTKRKARSSSQMSMKAGWGLSYRFVQRSPEPRIRLRHHLLPGDRHVPAREAGDREGHRDAVVVVRFDRRRGVAPAGMNQQRVGALLDG